MLVRRIIKVPDQQKYPESSALKGPGDSGFIRGKKFFFTP
jgi:hypothetical protein